VYSIENILAIGYELEIDCFGFCFTGFSLLGAMLFSSASNLKLLSVGIVLVSDYSGVFDRVQRTAEGPK